MGDYAYNLLKKGLDVSSMRQKAISSNIANLNTPNYKANKVRFEAELSNHSKYIGLYKTHENHLGFDLMTPKIEKRKNTYVNDNGNNVDIDLEMTENAANELYYATVVKQVNAKLGNLNTVINR